MTTTKLYVGLLSVMIGVAGISTGALFAHIKALNECRQENLILMNKLAETSQKTEELESVILFMESNNLPLMSIKKMTVGIQNKNPMNVYAMPENNKWDGQIGKDDRGHAIFTSFEYGLRAGAKVLINYHKKGINTIDALINVYCTGNQKAYKSFLSQQLGVSPTQKISLLAHLPQLMKGIVRFENGYDVFPDTAYIPYSVYK